jgi:hypothetical protein
MLERSALKDLLREKLTWSVDRYAAVEKLMTDGPTSAAPAGWSFHGRRFPKKPSTSNCLLTLRYSISHKLI